MEPACSEKNTRENALLIIIGTLIFIFFGLLFLDVFLNFNIHLFLLCGIFASIILLVCAMNIQGFTKTRPCYRRSNRYNYKNIVIADTISLNAGVGITIYYGQNKTSTILPGEIDLSSIQIYKDTYEVFCERQFKLSRKSTWYSESRSITVICYNGKEFLLSKERLSNEPVDESIKPLLKEMYIKIHHSVSYDKGSMCSPYYLLPDEVLTKYDNLPEDTKIIANSDEWVMK